MADVHLKNLDRRGNHYLYTHRRIDRHPNAGGWGNPFVVGIDGDRQSVIQQHRQWLQGQPQMLDLLAPELAGESLACWCHPRPCHGHLYQQILSGEASSDFPAQMPPTLVFGANLAGRHGKGAAAYARARYGAQQGVGEGPTGNAYAIPTKDERLRTRPPAAITQSLYQLLEYVQAHPEQRFEMTRVGCGLAGLDESWLREAFPESMWPNNLEPPRAWCAQGPAHVAVIGDVDGSQEAFDVRLHALLERLDAPRLLTNGWDPASRYTERFAVAHGYAFERFPAPMRTLGVRVLFGDIERLVPACAQSRAVIGHQDARLAQHASHALFFAREQHQEKSQSLLHPQSLRQRYNNFFAFPSMKTRFLEGVCEEPEPNFGPR